MLDLSKPVQTRDGRRVQILRTDMNNPHTPVAGILTWEDGEEFVCAWPIDGRSSVGRDSEDDLVNIPAKRTGWMNVYGHAMTDVMNGVIHPTRDKADKEALEGRLACIEVSFDEGQGL